MQVTPLKQFGLGLTAVLFVAGAAFAKSAPPKEKDLAPSDAPSVAAPVDMTADFQPIDYSRRLAAPDPPQRDALTLEEAPTNIQRDTHRFLYDEPQSEPTLARKPKKLKK